MTDEYQHRIAERVAALQTRIRELQGERDVELVAVTKGFGVQAIDAAVHAGCTSIGESYAQELRDKWPLRANPDLTPMVHFIGQLQRNKVRLVAAVVDVWQSVDRVSLAEEIARRAPAASVFVQVDATGEPGKGGCPVREVEALVHACAVLQLKVQGLMTVGPTSIDSIETRRCFTLVRSMATDLGLPDCSMGMTADLEIALECGSTHVRVGSAIFGERPRP